jgi:hypothetical protein
METNNQSREDEDVSVIGSNYSDNLLAPVKLSENEKI